MNTRRSATGGTIRENPARLDQGLKLLASQGRREILEYFITTETEVETVEVLSCKLARLEVDTDGAESPSTETAKTRLHHVHLPKLAEFDVIDYDARSGTVRYHGDEQVEAIVEFLAEL